jgi:uncharacterized protein
MRIFLDANILFSAAKSDGAIRRLLALVMGAGHECWVDGFVVEEARRNLMVKASASLGELNALLARVHLASFQGDDDSIESQLPLPEKDRPVLAAAIRHGCEALVTGDKSHFGSLYGKTIHDVAIHSPRSLAKYKVRRSRSR